MLKTSPETNGRLMGRRSIDIKACDRDIDAHGVHSLTSAALACTSASQDEEGKQKPINIV